MRFFSYESRFSQLLMKLSCSCLLNILWFICSLPIFTIGASTTALYYACLKVIRDEESHAWELFFRSFKENFKQATQLWLILLIQLNLFAAEFNKVVVALTLKLCIEEIHDGHADESCDKEV